MFMGLGYIGLPTAIIAAKHGVDVVGVDINPKVVENSSRDVQIAFANELSLICDKAGINVWELISLANKHPRVNILQPGCGVGGHCILLTPISSLPTTQPRARLLQLHATSTTTRVSGVPRR